MRAEPGAAARARWTPDSFSGSVPKALDSRTRILPPPVLSRSVWRSVPSVTSAAGRASLAAGTIWAEAQEATQRSVVAALRGAAAAIVTGPAPIDSAIARLIRARFPISKASSRPSGEGSCLFALDSGRRNETGTIKNLSGQISASILPLNVGEQRRHRRSDGPFHRGETKEIMSQTVTRRTLGVSLAALAAASSTLARAATPAAGQSAGKPLYKDPAQPVELRVRDLLSRMTLEEKAAQLVGIWLTKAKIQTPEGEFSAVEASRNFPNGLGQISRPSDRKGLKPAAVVDAAAGADDGSINRNAKETARYVNAAQKWAMEQTRLGVPMLMHDEALHGYVARDATSFPQAIALASTFDPELVEKSFAVAAREMRARGSNIALAPVVDVARDPRWGRIEETYGEDPHLCAEIGLAAIRGFQGKTLPLAKDKVFVTLKHMTGHGQPENGTNVGPPRSPSGRCARTSSRRSNGR
jgi:hypothetical protein